MAGTEVGSLYYDLNIDDKKLKSQLDRSDKDVQGFGSKLAGLGKKLALGFAVAGTAAAAFGVKSVKAFTESENVMAQTNAVLKSTGHAAGVTANQVTKLAAALQKTTKFSDEQIQSAENLLLTFTAIGKDIFPQATKTVLDMSTALGQDLKSSSIQLGKALQDPILGVTALRRVGVNFSSAQQDVIRNLVETGQKAKAQQLILKELRVEFGGSAEAAGKTFAGKLAILKNSFNDLQESIGSTIVTALIPLATALSDFIASDQFQAWLKQLNEWLAVNIPKAVNFFTTSVWPLLKQAFDTTWPIVKTLFDWLVKLITFLADHTQAVKNFALAFIALKVAIMMHGAATAFALTMASIRTQMLLTSGGVKGLRGLFVGLRAFLASPFVVTLAIAAALVAVKKVIEAIQSINRAWDAVNNSMNAAEIAGNSNDAVIRQLKELMKSGTPAQKKRAKATLAGLAAGNSFASGVTNFRGGLAYVHQGEMLVNMPKGTDVLPKREVDKMGSNTTNFHIGQINNQQDENWVLRRIDRNQVLESRGLSPT